jgi:hypothetical protein
MSDDEETQDSSDDSSGDYGEGSGDYGDDQGGSGAVEASFHIPFIDCDEVCHVYYPESGDPAGWCGAKCTYRKGHEGLHHCSNEHMWPTGYNPDRWDSPDSPFHPTPLEA